MPRSRDTASRRALALLELADSGAFTLPAEIHAARTALERVIASREQAMQSWTVIEPDEIVERLAHELADAAGEGKLVEQDVFAAVRAAEEERRAADLNLKIAGQAVEIREIALRVTIDERSVEIIEKHLRPALEDTLASVQEAAKPLEPGTLDKPESLLGDEKRGKAYLRLVEAARRHTAIRTAQRQLAGGNLPEPWELAIYRNAPEIFREGGIDWRARRQFGKVPWPTHPLEYLVWLTTHPIAAPWIPTPDEFQALALQVMETTKVRQAPSLIG